jgi:hypothetical protein
MCAPGASTSADEAAPRVALTAASLHLALSVSSDEEYVHIRASGGGREFDLGCRRHNYLLLILARRRLADRAEGAGEGSCGWFDPSDLAHDPTMAAPQLNIDVFRIREQFARVVVDPAYIIERRPRQLRIGTGHIAIYTL